MQSVNTEYVDAAQQAATEDVKALLDTLARAHQILSSAGVPMEGTLTARLLALVDERNQLRALLEQVAATLPHLSGYKKTLLARALADAGFEVKG